MSRTFLRFLIFGAVNTGATYALFLVLVGPLGEMVAYTVIYIFGIILSYVLNSVFVFRAVMAWSSAIQFPVVYVVQYLWGILTLYLCTSVLGIDPRVGALISIVTSIPITFLISRRIIDR